MNKKSRSIIRAIIITLSVFAVIIVSLSFCLMKHLMGVSKEKTEAEARAFHNIDESWQSIQATNDDVSAMLFFPADRSSHFYSIYCKHKGLSKGFFFRIGGTISEISSECVQFVFEAAPATLRCVSMVKRIQITAVGLLCRGFLWVIG